MNTKKLTLALMGAAMLSANALADPELVAYDVNGDGTTAEGEKAYKITSYDDLCWLADYVKNSADEYVTVNAFLANNITVNENLIGSLKYDTDGNVTNTSLTEWSPIGLCYKSVDLYYYGTFDGQGNTISGLYFNNKDQGYVGLFGQIGEGATIKNVSVIDSYFNGNNDVAGVCGYNNLGTIENCHFDGSVNGIEYIGGVCGYNYGTFKNSDNAGSVNGNLNVGGVCGYSQKSIEKCYNVGSINGEKCVGGVCGFNDRTTIEYCYNTGNVSGDSNVGGVCGYSDSGDIEYCYNEGSINSFDELLNSDNKNTGGVCGYSNESAITSCYNNSEVLYGYANIGGVCGYSSKSTITNCYDTGRPKYFVVNGKKICGDNEESTITYCYYFNLNGGTLGEYSIVVDNGNIALPTSISREGFKFKGWFGNTAFDGTAIESEDANFDVHTLYAKWVEPSDPTAIKAVEAENSNKTIKTIKDGQIVIIRNGVMYDMQGRKL